MPQNITLLSSKPQPWTYRFAWNAKLIILVWLILIYTHVREFWFRPWRHTSKFRASQSWACMSIKVVWPFPRELSFAIFVVPVFVVIHYVTTITKTSRFVDWKNVFNSLCSSSVCQYVLHFKGFMVWVWHYCHYSSDYCQSKQLKGY